MYDSIYSLSVYVIHVFMHLAAWFHPKARNRIRLLKTIPLPTTYPSQAKRYWFHCASLGEYEMVKPLIGLFRTNDPDCYIAVSFYSPSGFLHKGSNEDVNWFGLLPADTPSRAAQWVNCLQPDLAVFVKYEFWLNLLKTLQRKQIPTVLIAARFNEGHRGFFYKIHLNKALSCFSLILTANRTSLAWLNQLSIKAAFGGDPRVDSIISKMSSTRLTRSTTETPYNPAMVWGSIWPSDAHLLSKMISDPDLAHWRHIIVPHETDDSSIKILISKADIKELYSLDSTGEAEKRIHVVNYVGKLLSLYGKAETAYVGGGFGKGVHNVLEPAWWQIPVLFGPKYSKDPAAANWVSDGMAFPVRNYDEFKNRLKDSLSKTQRERIAVYQAEYFTQCENTSRKIYSAIQSLLSRLQVN